MYRQKWDLYIWNWREPSAQSTYIHTTSTCILYCQIVTNKFQNIKEFQTIPQLISIVQLVSLYLWKLSTVAESIHILLSPLSAFDLYQVQRVTDRNSTATKTKILILLKFAKTATTLHTIIFLKKGSLKLYYIKKG